MIDNYHAFLFLPYELSGINRGISRKGGLGGFGFSVPVSFRNAEVKT